MPKIGKASTTKSLINQHDFKIKKKFGQNFLIDPNILEKIATVSEIDKETLVIEIGPGLGGLTEHLIQHAKHVIAYEIDKDLIPILQENFKNKNVTFIEGDFLTMNIDQTIKEANILYEKIVLVANLPYYITTPIIMKVIEESKEIKEMVLMMQLEVARRITSSPKSKDYNSLSIAIQYRTDATIKFTVPRTVFIPAPNVDSAIVQLIMKDKIEVLPKDEAFFYRIVRLAFAQRRKTLVNNLHSGLGYSKDYLQNTLEKLGISPNARAESLSVLQFISLSDTLER